MSTLTFAAIEDISHSNNNIPNPELSEMESDMPEELPLPKCMARKALNSRQMDNSVPRGFFSFIL